MSGKIITIAIHKGGTGKTTVAVNLSRFAHEKKCKTLIVDLDTQGNATDNFISEVPADSLTASMLFDAKKNKLPVVTVNGGLDIIPADAQLLSVERYPFETAKHFKTNISRFKKDYDLIVIDTPPTMGFAMLAPLTASDFTIAPIFPDSYSIKGVKALFERIKDIRNKHNPNLVFLGLLVNRWKRTSSAQNTVVATLRDKLPKFVLPVALGDHVHVEYAARNQHSVWYQARSGAHREAAKTFKTAMNWIFNKTVGGK